MCESTDCTRSKTETATARTARATDGGHSRRQGDQVMTQNDESSRDAAVSALVREAMIENEAPAPKAVARDTRKKDKAPRGVFRHPSGAWAIRYACGVGCAKHE